VFKNNIKKAIAAAKLRTLIFFAPDKVMGGSSSVAGNRFGSKSIQA
jgi:hypothetical protein